MYDELFQNPILEKSKLFQKSISCFEEFIIWGFEKVHTIGYTAKILLRTTYLY